MNWPKICYTLAGLIGILLIFTSCGNNKRSIEGSWKNDDGQIYIFRNDGTGLMIVDGPEKKDSLTFKYTTDMKSQPYKIDMTDFGAEPLIGKSFFGIFEMESAKKLRLDLGNAETPDKRPFDFHPEQSRAYKKI